MGKFKAFRKLIVEIASGPMDLKPARRLYLMWTAVAIMCVVNVAVAVIFGSWVSAGLSVVNLAFGVLMLRLAAVRVADAKHREEKRKWEHSMYAEWSR